jgi:hypothetical protein
MSWQKIEEGKEGSLTFFLIPQQFIYTAKKAGNHKQGFIPEGDNTKGGRCLYVILKLLNPYDQAKGVKMGN